MTKNQRTFLAIDIGNSNLKLGLFRNYNLIKWTSHKTGDFVNRSKWPIPLKGISRIGLASVVPPVTDTVLKKMIGYSVRIVTPENCGVLSRVKEPQKVGIDRLLNVKAAYHLSKTASIVADIGTAVTVDVCSSQGEFLGGIIMPGPRLWLSSLTQAVLLPHVSEMGLRGLVGKDTREAIASGVRYGLAGAIEHTISLLKKHYRINKVFLTGGGASFYRPLFAFRYIYQPHLTLMGIVLVLRDDEK
ncbi:MAG: type III pantothenate kinase [Candidatus Omnitrophica bacterium]|nr:type III pantothenate kinase [Candidatus Omnitrophota bacterium]